MAGLYKHVILAKFKDGVAQEKIDEIVKLGANLPSLIPEIKSFTWGLDESIRDKNQGFTHVFEATFESMEHIEYYYDHPDHVEFSKRIFPIIEKYLVVNYKPISATA